MRTYFWNQEIKQFELMNTIIQTSRGTYRCTRYFDSLAQSDHIMIEKRRYFLGIPIGWRQVDVQESAFQNCEELARCNFNNDAKFCVHMYEESLTTKAMLKNETL